MKKIIIHFLLFFAGASCLAECLYTFSCTQQGCVKVTDANCSIPSPLTSNQNLNIETNKFNSQGATFVSANTKPNVTPSNYKSSPYGCAENGSCYGDISSVNGTTKTIQVNGYYRGDGTYVRGHYRSSGR
jgi:hypothetical protein